MRSAAQVVSAPPLPSPKVTGVLDQADIDQLWSIISYIGEAWRLAARSTLDRSRFKDLVALKTTQTPSYYTLYRMTTALYTSLSRQYGPKGALAYLYTPNPASPPQNWEVVRAWAIQEFANLYVSQGAFRAYGWWLFPGFAGGPFDDPNHLPYRGI
ncbi:MAG: hypothetical protein DI526_22430 [Caulobacter segnis]|uniref:Uncharacterized protein n=2 Tax=Caulobacter segnis TaxID=88688 RepID=A0A2W5UTX0_9CAUL|nr:MAG: hypothetical protein DI526_22430 [Caulobacter segnis]